MRITIRLLLPGELTIEPSPHPGRELPHSFSGGVLVAHRHAFATVAEPLHHFPDRCTFLGEPCRSGVTQYVEGDVLQSGLALRLLKKKSKLRPRQQSPVWVLEEPCGWLGSDELVEMILEDRDQLIGKVNPSRRLVVAGLQRPDELLAPVRLNDDSPERHDLSIELDVTRWSPRDSDQRSAPKVASKIIARYRGSIASDSATRSSAVRASRSGALSAPAPLM